MADKFAKNAQNHCSRDQGHLFEQQVVTIFLVQTWQPSQVIKPSGARLPATTSQRDAKQNTERHQLTWGEMAVNRKGKLDMSWTRIWRTQNSYNTILVGMYSHSLWNIVRRFVLQTIQSRSPKRASYPICRCTSKGNGISICKRCCACIFHHRSQPPNFTLCLSMSKSRLWDLMIPCTII